MEIAGQLLREGKAEEKEAMNFPSSALFFLQFSDSFPLPLSSFSSLPYFQTYVILCGDYSLQTATVFSFSSFPSSSPSPSPCLY
jgi:hypothetical protein